MCILQENNPMFSLYVFMLFLAGFGLIFCNQNSQPEVPSFIEVSCNYSGMVVDLVFQNVFKGTIYPRANFFNPDCRYVSNTGSKVVSYYIPLTDCGNLHEEKDGYIYVSNVIIIQEHTIVETGFDVVQNVSCKLPIPTFTHERKSLHENHPIRFHDGEIESWMDLYSGLDMLGVDKPNTLLVGDEFLITVHLKDGGVFADLEVVKCWAHEEELLSSSLNAIQIFDVHSCKNSEWIDGFNFTNGLKNISDKMAYGVSKAFKFHESKNLHLTCSVQICRNSCVKYCDMPEIVRFNSFPSRFKRSSEDFESSRAFSERNRLMKATIKALTAKLLNRDRARLSVDDSSFLKRASELESTTVTTLVPTTMYPKLDNITGVSDAEIVWNDVYSFNLTNNIVVLTKYDVNFRQERSNTHKRYADCVPKARFTLLAAVVTSIAFCLILICICLVLYIRKEKKRTATDDMLLYNGF